MTLQKGDQACLLFPFSKNIKIWIFEQIAFEL